MADFYQLRSSLDGELIKMETDTSLGVDYVKITLFIMGDEGDKGYGYYANKVGESVAWSLNRLHENEQYSILYSKVCVLSSVERFIPDDGMPYLVLTLSDPGPWQKNP